MIFFVAWMSGFRLMYVVLELFAAFDVIDCRIFEILVKRIDLQSVVLLFIEKCFLNCLQILEQKP